MAEIPAKLRKQLNSGGMLVSENVGIEIEGSAIKQ